MGITVTSDDNQSEENTAGYNEECTSASEVRSTKSPTSTKEPKISKRKKRETQEDLLLQKALSCMEKAEKNTAKRSDDDDDIFYTVYSFRTTLN